MRICFSRTGETELIDQSFDIAWGILLKSGDLGRVLINPVAYATKVTSALPL